MHTMKIKKNKFIVIPAVLVLLSLVAWSPPNSDKLVVGGTQMTSSTGRLVVIGSGSEGKADRGLVVGYGHSVSVGATERSGSIISGSTNSVDTTCSIVSGFNNMVSSSGSLENRNSCAIGGNNELADDHGYAIGYLNVVAGDYGSAYGYGLRANAAKGVAIGRYNSNMASNDVFVVGTGSSDSVRSTAISVKADGSVLLGRAQGDISMGNYQ